MTITRPTVPAAEIRVGDRLLVIRGEMGDVVPAIPLVTKTATSDSGEVVLSLAERLEQPLMLARDVRVTVERAT